jgi:hypothetical protein
MYASALLGFAIVITTFVLLLWFMIEVGLAWVSGVLIALVAWLLFSSLKNRRTGFDIRR